ncbi:type IV pilus modification PilV family protein [Planococcus kocurii]|uniref:type IV pilus modification PilV family protein n=1 Tax=Planococcus kocurii TaxID=1374 RepID=UPI003D05C3C9
MKRLIQNEKGLTLVEVLASTVLITLILISFFTLFAQGAKINITSETIVDSTYLAQKEMESIIALSKESLADTLKIEMDNKYGIGVLTSNNEWIKYEKNIPNSTEKYSIRVKNISTNRINVVVEVIEKENNAVRAKMENILIWEEDNQ